jgi:hypothetical protein
MIKCTGISSNPQSADLLKGKKSNFKIIKLGCKYDFLIWDSGYLYLKMNNCIKIPLFLIERNFKPRDCLDFTRLSKEGVVYGIDQSGLYALSDLTLIKMLAII